MSDNGWELTPNPLFDGRTPESGATFCHDGSPSIDVECERCSEGMHVHYTQVAGITPDKTIAMWCKHCGEPLGIPARIVLEGFEEMRRQGWLL